MPRRHAVLALSLAQARTPPPRPVHKPPQNNQRRGETSLSHVGGGPSAGGGSPYRHGAVAPGTPRHAADSLPAPADRAGQARRQYSAPYVQHSGWRASNADQRPPETSYGHQHGHRYDTHYTHGVEVFLHPQR